MTVVIQDQATGKDREIVDWQAGTPVYADEVASDKDGTATPRSEVEAVHWLLKPGDLVADWCGVISPDGRGLLRLFVNLALYSKLVAIAVLAFS